MNISESIVIYDNIAAYNLGIYDTWIIRAIC